MLNQKKETIKEIIEQVLRENFFIPVGVSNRHLHISREACDALFGQGYELTPMRDLAQPGQFAAEEKVDLVSGDRALKGVRILGPLRDSTQIEISKTDARQIRKNPPIRQSGDIKGSESVVLRGPKGEYRIEEGLIVASRHAHVSAEDAKKYEIQDGGAYSIEIGGKRPMIMKNVVMRVSDEYSTELHLDIDEANAADLNQGDYVRLLK